MSTKYTVKKQNNPLRFKQNLMIKTTNKQKVSCLALLTRVVKIFYKKVPIAKLCLVNKFIFIQYPVLAWLLSNSICFEIMKI